jgi:hypothetical protein
VLHFLSKFWTEVGRTEDLFVFLGKKKKRKCIIIPTGLHDLQIVPLWYQNELKGFGYTKKLKNNL